jgi:hypothetical protein
MIHESKITSMECQCSGFDHFLRYVVFHMVFQLFSTNKDICRSSITDWFCNQDQGPQ